jgi:hypothetical protein
MSRKKTWMASVTGTALQILDGSTRVMPDTPRNQAAYPQPAGPRPGLGFPIAWILVVYRLAIGTVVEAAIGPIKGSGPANDLLEGGKVVANKVRQHPSQSSRKTARGNAVSRVGVVGSTRAKRQSVRMIWLRLRQPLRRTVR